ncbi:MAG: hypothetical protein HY549_02625, partial [Elusimicrobia bacterium]|nr:hypothetical protein [Elusimicrobiota bacterium]
MNTASVAVRSDLRQEDYTRLWGIILAVAAAGLLWIFEGRAFFRKHFWGVPPPAESERVSTQFVALAFPRISKDGERFSMAPGEFQAILLELRAKGYRPVGFSDIREFYETGRKLPPKAVLIALDRDNPDSVHLADRALRRARMKAGIFLNKTPPSEPGFQRRTLTAHAI